MAAKTYLIYTLFLYGAVCLGQSRAGTQTQKQNIQSHQVTVHTCVPEFMQISDSHDKLQTGLIQFMICLRPNKAPQNIYRMQVKWLSSVHRDRLENQ